MKIIRLFLHSVAGNFTLIPIFPPLFTQAYPLFVDIFVTNSIFIVYKASFLTIYNKKHVDNLIKITAIYF